MSSSASALCCDPEDSPPAAQAKRIRSPIKRSPLPEPTRPDSNGHSSPSGLSDISLLPPLQLASLSHLPDETSEGVTTANGNTSADQSDTAATDSLNPSSKTGFPAVGSQSEAAASAQDRAQGSTTGASASGLNTDQGTCVQPLCPESASRKGITADSPAGGDSMEGSLCNGAPSQPPAEAQTASSSSASVGTAVVPANHAIPALGASSDGCVQTV